MHTNPPNQVKLSLQEHLMLFALMVVCFIVFCYMDYRYLDIEFLSFTRGDERPQFLQLQKMYEGLLALDVKKFFAFEFYNYGFFYYLLSFLSALPFIITENYPLQIYAPRVLNALFSIANLWILYKIARIYLAPRTSMLILLLLTSMGAFWHLGFAFKPDVFQGFFVLLCAYFLLQDRGMLGQNYTRAWLALGLGIGLAKFQAILFIPMIYAYVFCHTSGALRDIARFYQACKRSIVATFGMFGIWILTNPYLLHPRGFNAWLSMFELNMRSNATNHGAYTHVSLSEKLSQVIELYYFEILVFLALSIAGLYCCIITLKWLIWQNPHTLDSATQDSMCQPCTQANSTSIEFAPIATGFFISLAYLLLFVNKTWEAYYFSTMALGLTLAIPLTTLCAITWSQIAKIATTSPQLSTKALLKTSKGGGQHTLCHANCALSLSSILLALLLGLQILGGSMSGIYTKVFTKYNKPLESIHALDDELMTLLRPVVDSKAVILSEHVDFSFLSLGLKPTQVHQAFGLIDPASFVYAEWASKPRTMPFIPKDFLVIRNTPARQNPAIQAAPRDENEQKSRETFGALMRGDYPYKLIAQSVHFLVFANTDTAHSNITKPTHKENP